MRGLPETNVKEFVCNCAGKKDSYIEVLTLSKTTPKYTIIFSRRVKPPLWRMENCGNRHIQKAQIS